MYIYIYVCVCVCWGVGGFPGASAGKESAFNVRDLDSIPGLGRSRDGNSFRILQYSEELLGLYSPWGHKESDTTKRLSLPKIYQQSVSTVSNQHVKQHL